jgi:hypothetical protein
LVLQLLEVQSGQNLRMSGSDAPVRPRLANPARSPLPS